LLTYLLTIKLCPGLPPAKSGPLVHIYIQTYIYLNQATWPIDITERIKEMHEKTTKNEKEYTFTYMKRNTYILLKTLRHTDTEIFN